MTGMLGRTRGRRIWILAALSVAVMVVAGIAVSSAAAAETTWLCKPGLANNPCLSSEETTVQLGNGSSSIEHAQPASNPPIDCFYVYPTVSSQGAYPEAFKENANLEIDPEETQVAINQASRFSQTCKVYAPMYPQLTLAAIDTPGAVTTEGQETAYLGVLDAFEEYMSVYNKGRGFVLIGHSQGSLLLEQLIKEQIDTNPTLRKQLVSAIIPGGNVLVPKGETVGGTFKNIPACQLAQQTGCVVGYSSFLTEPPAEAYFGRVNSPLIGEKHTEEEDSKLEVMCVNPAQLFPGGSAPDSLLRYQSTSPFPGLLGSYYPYHSKSSGLSTPWVSMPEQYSGQCDRNNGATWLQLTDIGPVGDSREVIEETISPQWGTHLDDVNVALGNLVGLAGLQAAAYNIPVVTGLPSSITQTTTTLNATVNPNGAEVTVCKFEYGLTSSYGSSAPCSSLPGSGSSPVAVSAALTGLVANTTYHFRISATNATGTSNGRDETLTTEPNLSATAPKVETKAASPITQTTATLNATVNPNGGQVTECKFEYGSTNSYGSSTPCASLPGSGSTPVAVSASVSGLTQHSTYHFRISATNPGGVSKGGDETLKTLAAGGGHWYGDAVKLPASEAEARYVVGWGTLTLKGEAGSGKGESVTCRSASGGRIWNPAGGGAGRGDTETLAVFDCESVGICKAGEVVTIAPASLPWASELQATGTTGDPYRLGSMGVRMVVSCNGVAAIHIEGETEPLAPAGEHKGTGALHPGFLESDAGAGEQQIVEGFAGPEVGTVKTGGDVKTLGYEEQELIQAK